MQVWVTARAQTALLASGSPVSPSQTTMPTSPTPRLVSSVRDVHPVLGALPTVTGPQPEDVALTVDVHAQGDVDGAVGEAGRRGS
jgi:hypothetical protein